MLTVTSNATANKAEIVALCSGFSFLKFSRAVNVRCRHDCPPHRNDGKEKAEEPPHSAHAGLDEWNSTYGG
eukprot:1500111-Amphidinium_carterae.1